MAKILIIDDDEALSKMLKITLERDGHQVTTSVNGKLGIIEFKKNPTDLVITDLYMPEKEGIETIMELKKEFPALKIMAMSGGGGRGDTYSLEVAKSIGADKTMVKPFAIDKMRQAVDEMLNISEIT